MSANRADVRKTIATLIRANSSLAQVVYSCMPADFQGQSPVVTVTGAGSERPRMTLRGGKTTFHLVVETFVLYSDPTATPPWTEANAEDAMDGLELEIATIVDKNPSGSGWSDLRYETVSAVSKVTIGGKAYLYEAIPLVVEVL